MKKEEKRGQVTVFIIIAIIIVAVAALIYFLSPGITTTTEFNENNPEAFLRGCMEDDLMQVQRNISLSGGVMEPENYYLYEDNRVQYLCYTEENYIPCVVQKPLISKNFKEELEREITPKFNECLGTLEERYQEDGYRTTLERDEIGIELFPNRMEINSNASLTAASEETLQYDGLSISTNSNIYELLSIANSIVGMEARYGDAETTTYMNYYPDVKVEKRKQSDGTTIYILTDRNTQDKFQFASRSVAWPPGLERWKQN